MFDATRGDGAVGDGAPGADSPCPWCSAERKPGADRCRDCGAALIPSAALADLRISGVTDVDPALEAYNAQPWRLHGPSPSQGLAGPAILGAMGGGPGALAAIGGLAAVAAVEYLSAGPDGSGRPVDIESVGELSGYAVQALDREARSGDPAE